MSANPFPKPRGREVTEAQRATSALFDLHASRDEMANLLDIVRIRLADARPFGGPDDAMLTAEIAATLKRAGR